MGHILVFNHMTLDGVMQAPGREDEDRRGGFTHGGWARANNDAVMAGVFMSPTRNLTANTREVRHVNPWNHPVPVHTYQEYEDEFRERMRDAGLPLEKES